jgi:hypothetical protein
LTSGAEIFFFAVVLVDVSAEDIYWEGGGRIRGGGERERERERENSASADSSDKSRGILNYLNGAYRSGIAEGAAQNYLAQLLFVRKAGG